MTGTATCSELRVDECGSINPPQLHAHLHAATHRGEAQCLLVGREAAVEVGVAGTLDEPARGIERRVPRHVGERAERQPFVAARTRLGLRRLDEGAAVSATCVRRLDRDLLEVRDPVDLEDVHEPDGRACGIRRRDQDETRVREP